MTGTVIVERRAGIRDGRTSVSSPGDTNVFPWVNSPGFRHP